VLDNYISLISVAVTTYLMPGGIESKEVSPASSQAQCQHLLGPGEASWQRASQVCIQEGELTWRDRKQEGFGGAAYSFYNTSLSGTNQGPQELP
jgi:hypothetical protein